MAYDVNVRVVTGLASGDLSTKQFQLVSFDTNGQVAITSDAAAADGVLLDKPDSQGKRCAVATEPGQICRVLAGGTITNGDYLEVASGKAVTHSAGKIIGRALSAAVANDIIPVLLIFQR